MEQAQAATLRKILAPLEKPSITGVVVGGTRSPSGETHAFRYFDGKHEDLGALGERLSIARGVNSSGVVVGLLGPSLASTHAFVFVNGSMRDITSKGAGGRSFADVITDSGQVLVNTVEPLLGTAHISVYRLDGSMSNLDGLTYKNATGTGMNISGQICGSYYSLGGEEKAFLYEHGKALEIGTLGGSMSGAWAINVHGMVVGESRIKPRSRVRHAFSFSGGAMTDLGTLGGVNSVALSVNASGHVVGRSETSAGVDAAFIWENRRMQNLNDLLTRPLPHGIRLREAVAINDAEQILAEGVEVSGSTTVTHGYVLTPKQ